uniref:Uncharacterized protein n=1 Tax=Glossina austeni TaxID=7395 RepID=A0A1A9V8K2_GLOAU
MKCRDMSKERELILFATFLFFSFISLTQEASSRALKKQRDVESLDLTKDLTDAEIEMALNDLSLPDLNALSELIDSSNKIDYNYEDFLQSNNRDPSLYGLNSNNHDYAGDVLDVDDNIYDQPQGFEQNFLNMPQEQLDIDLTTDTQRIKRDDHDVQVPVDEEYIKQLDFSFPRDLEQNNHEENEIKKDHVRVKRN